MAASLEVVSFWDTLKVEMWRESLATPNYLYRISFPRLLKTSKYNKTYIMLNFVTKTLEFKVSKEQGNDIRYKYFGTPRFSRDISDLLGIFKSHEKKDCYNAKE